MTFGMIYWLLPRFPDAAVEQKLMVLHFWTATVGIVLYVLSIYLRRHHAGPDVAGVRRDRQPGQYPDFIETVTQLMPFYWIPRPRRGCTCSAWSCWA